MAFVVAFVVEGSTVVGVIVSMVVGGCPAGRHMFPRGPFLKQTAVYGNISLVYVQSLRHPRLRALGSLARKE